MLLIDLKRNAPTVYNAALNLYQNWDGSAISLQEQASMAIVRSSEMGNSFEALSKKLSKIAQYKNQFDEIYSGEISQDTITDALAEFQKTLITVGSPFDRFLKGDQTAISDEAKLGYQKFKSYGCSACHQGENVGGNLLQKFGIHHDAADRSKLDKDLGRYEITKDEEDIRVFKVPSLRLAVHTGPYFHDGSVATLEKPSN